MSTQTPAYCRSVAFREFASAVRDAESPDGLFRAAWAIALHDMPQAQLSTGEKAIGQLADTVAKRVRSRSSEALLAHLHDVLFDVVGFNGNVEDYYAAGNSYLPEVLETRRGLPITLALIYRTVAARIGLVVHGVNSPGHFLAEAEIDGGPAGKRHSMFIDPFHGGRVLTIDEALERVAEATRHEIDPTPAMLVRATSKQWLARILHNLQAIFGATGRERDVFAMQELEQLLEAGGK